MRITAAAAPYVNLGDSFSSGLGSEAMPTAHGNEIDMDVYRHSSGLAFRSDRSAAALLARERGYDLRDVSYSGANVDQMIRTGTRGEAPQVDALSADTKLATVIIGANDTGFHWLVEPIRAGELSANDPSVTETFARIDALQGKIELALGEITRRAPNAEVRIAGYPYLFPRPGQASGPLGSFLSEDEKQLMQTMQDRVNGAISAAAAKAGPHVKYIDPNAPGSPFIAVDANGSRDDTSTSPDRWLNGEADRGSQAFLIHPNARGQQFYEQLYAASLPDAHRD